MNIPAIIRRVKGSKKYTVLRHKGGAYNALTGVFEGAPPEEIQIVGSSQPATPDELVSIPEGTRDKERRRFYSFPDLKNVDAHKLAKGDTVKNIDGKDYRVETVEHWPGYSKSVVVTVNEE